MSLHFRGHHVTPREYRFVVLGTAAPRLTGHELRPSDHPVARYLARLGPRSRPTVLSSLHTCARILLDDPAATAWDVDWPRLDYLVLACLRDRLAAHFGSPASAQRAVTHLRQVLGEAFQAGTMTPEAWMRAQRLHGPPGAASARGRALSDPEIARLMAGPLTDPSPMGRRDAGILAVLFTTGIRRAECVGLELADWNPTAGTLRIRVAKNGRQRIVTLPSWARPVLAAWVAVHPAAVLGALWIAAGATGPPRRLSWASVGRVVARWATRAGLGAVHPHDARRTVATRMLRAGLDPLLVRHHLGHASVTTTSRYDLRTADDCAAALERLPCPWGTL